MIDIDNGELSIRRGFLPAQVGVFHAHCPSLNNDRCHVLIELLVPYWNVVGGEAFFLIRWLENIREIYIRTWTFLSSKLPLYMIEDKKEISIFKYLYTVPENQTILILSFGCYFIF